MKMRAPFDHKLVTASAVLILCSVGAGILGAMNSPSAAAPIARAQITDVNRANKADQLATMSIQQAPQHVAPPADGLKTSLQRPPLGCDGAFSPVADPARAAVYKRCTV
jgi:hypothetical protein